jgi:putative DNA primase/helicase
MESGVNDPIGVLDSLVDAGRQSEGLPSRQEEQAREAGQDDRDATIRRLAALQESAPLEYDRERTREARRLRVRTRTLDNAVAGLVTNNSGKQLAGSALEFPEPEPWPAAIDGAELLDELTTAFRRHLVLPDGAAEAMSLWTIFSYCLDAFRSNPRLAFISTTKRCGKSTALDMLAQLVSRPLSTSNISGAGVFRIIDLAHPTLLIDEADTFLPENEVLRGVLNSGHSTAAPYVVRCVGDDYTPRQFSTWTPVVIARIGKLPDTLTDRSIVIAMQRRTANERVEPLSDDGAREALSELKRKIVRWIADNSTGLAGIKPAMPTRFINRLADNWRPLLAISEVAGGEWAERARNAAVMLAGSADLEDDDIKVRLLADIRLVLDGEPGPTIGSAELCDKLGKFETAPWSTFSRGKPLSPAKLARMLRTFPIYVRKLGARNGYATADFANAFARYLTVPPDQSSKAPEPQRRQGENALSEVPEAFGDGSFENKDNPSLPMTSGTLELSQPLTKQEEGLLV